MKTKEKIFFTVGIMSLIIVLGFIFCTDMQLILENKYKQGVCDGIGFQIDNSGRPWTWKEWIEYGRLNNISFKNGKCIRNTELRILD